MIDWGDIYKVVVAMTPLYFALGLGYGSVRWWRIFTHEQCQPINTLVSFFTLPLYTFQFTASVNPFNVNIRFLAADTISKLTIVAVLCAWAKCSSKGSYCWSITTYSLSVLANTLIVGVPLLSAMYGPMAQDMVVQVSVLQGIIWVPFLLFVLELRKTQTDVIVENDDHQQTQDLEINENVRRRSFWSLMKIVWLKLAVNPNSYASIIGLAWACISNRWDIQMPSIIEGSILIMSRAGSGMAMFSMGLFMAQQEKLFACGMSLTVLGMVLRFIAGPMAMAIGCIAVGLRGTALQVAIIQAALPQSITSFIYARQYDLHAEVLSTAVIFGTLVSLPVLIGYYCALGFLA